MLPRLHLCTLCWMSVPHSKGWNCLNDMFISMMRIKCVRTFNDVNLGLIFLSSSLCLLLLFLLLNSVLLFSLLLSPLLASLHHSLRLFCSPVSSTVSSPVGFRFLLTLLSASLLLSPFSLFLYSSLLLSSLLYALFYALDALFYALLYALLVSVVIRVTPCCDQY